jgi:hypothetical protein
MHQLLATEAHVQVPPMLFSDPFYRITYLIKDEIRKYKWIEAEKGRALSWEQACHFLSWPSSVPGSSSSISRPVSSISFCNAEMIQPQRVLVDV